MKNPCFSCEDRKQACHTKCEAYQEFWEFNRRKGDRRKKEVNAVSDILSVKKIIGSRY